MPVLSLPWPRRRNGYRIDNGDCPEPGEGTGSAAAARHPDTVGPFIVAVDGPSDVYDCMKIDGLYRRLLAVPRTAEGALEFANRYGLLNAGKFMSLWYFCEVGRVIRELIGFADAENWEALEHWLIDNREVVLVHPEFRADGNVRRRIGKPELSFGPQRLADAILIQFLEDLSTGAVLRNCKRPECGNWFKYGPGTRHRTTAQFCSPACQKAHAYARSRKTGT